MSRISASRPIQGLGLIYVGLAVAFAWTQKGPQSLSWIVTMAGILATALMWAADKRNYSGLVGWSQIAAEIEKDNLAAIPPNQRFFDRPQMTRTVRHSILITGSSILIGVFFLIATVYLGCNRGVLPK